jgi:hypothetical protein
MGAAARANQQRRRMKRVLTFDGGADSGRICAAILMALRFGRNHVQQAPGKAILRQERDIKRALAAITEPDPDKVADLLCQKCGHLVMPRDAVARRLKEGGGSVVLTQADIELISERVDKGMWTGDSAEDLADTLDFLSAAPEAPKADA